MTNNYLLDDSTTTLATLSDDVRHVTTLLQLDAITDKQRDSINALSQLVLLQVADIIDNETARLKKLID